MGNAILWLLAHAGSLLLACLTVILPLIVKGLLSLINNAKVRDIITRSLQEIGSAVLSVGQTFVSECRKASDDGTLTEEEAKKALSLAINQAKANMGPLLNKLIKILIGVDVDTWIASKAETALATYKALNVIQSSTSSVKAPTVSDPQ